MTKIITQLVEQSTKDKAAGRAPCLPLIIKAGKYCQFKFVVLSRRDDVTFGETRYFLTYAIQRFFFFHDKNMHTIRVSKETFDLMPVGSTFNQVKGKIV